MEPQMTAVERTLSMSSLLIKARYILESPCIKTPIDLAAKTGWNVATAKSVLSHGSKYGFLYQDRALGIYRKRVHHSR